MKRTRKLVSVLLTLALLLGLVPMTAVPAMAAEPTEIEELTLSFMTPSEIPAVGEPIKYMSGGRLTEEDNRIELTGNILLWCIDDSSTIINKTYDDTGMYFEAGRSYNAEIVVEVLDPEQYTIGENTKITLTNPGDFTYTSEISSISAISSSFFAHMKLTITMDGERTYPDITKVVFQDLVSPTDGMSVTESKTDVHYSNCRMTSGIWLGDVWGKDEFDNNTFVAGETYTYRVVLTARDGYKFYENATIQLTSGGVAKAPSYYAYTNDNRTLTLDYTYTVPSVTWVEGIEAAITRYEFNLTPMAGNNCVLFDDTLEVDENAPYQVVGELGRTWYSEDGTMLTSHDKFEAGKTYYFDYAYSIKNEYRHLYRFVPDNLTATITGESYTGEGFQKAERVEYSNSDNTYVKLRYYFTAQFPAGVGSSAANPAFCNSYEEFKYAMESDDIRYVALGNVEDTLPLVSMEETGAYADNRWPGIWVNSNKDLILLGNAQFTAPNAEENVHRVYDHLIQVRSGSRLAISGSGSLTFHGNAVGWTTSVVEVVNGGVLTINSVTVKGDTGNRTSFCYGINVNGGTLYVNDGTVIGTNRHDQAPISAVNLYDGTAYINGGTFYSDVSDGAAGSKHYGLYINEGGTYYLSGGTFEGVSMPYASTMSDYVAAGYTMTVNGVKTNPASCGTTNGVVEVYQEISKVDIHVNSPAAGKSPAMYPEDVYMVPEGCTVTDLVWYENGQPWYMNGGNRFEAGNTYKVEITLVADEGVKFAKPMTSATINYKNAEVSAFAGSWENGIVMTLDFGACPNVVPQVDLTVTAPVEGNNPSYSIGCGSDAYYAVGGSSNYTEYRKWYMSSDNDDWWEINGNHSFMSGYYYKFVVDIRTNNGYEFPLYDNGSSIVPDVSATVNGYYADVIKAYDQDPSRYITVEYNFGECSDSVVEKITVENVTEPVAGQTPDYNWSIRGTGYQMNSGKNNENYGVRNGMQWMTADWDYVFPNDTFVPGKTYICRLNLVSDNGFAFAQDKDYRPTVTATVNGGAAVIEEGWTNASEARVYYTFTCKQPEINTIMLYNLAEPKVGETPDTAVTAAYPEYYTVTGVKWLDEEDNEIGEFETGRLYTAEITVAAKDYSGVDGCIFADTVTAYIDGTEVTGWGNEVTTNSDNTVTVRYEFRKAAQAPTVKYYFFLDQPTGGELFVDESLNVSWSTTFDADYYDILYWDGQMWDQWDCINAAADSADHDFVHDLAGTYDFRIVAYQNGTAYATSNEFHITWKDTVSAGWGSGVCSVKLEKEESGVATIAASYGNGKLVKAVRLTAKNPTADLRADEVKVFFLNDKTFAPIRKAKDL